MHFEIKVYFYQSVCFISNLNLNMSLCGRTIVIFCPEIEITVVSFRKHQQQHERGLALHTNEKWSSPTDI